MSCLELYADSVRSRGETSLPTVDDTPLEGNDLLEDLAPRKCHRIPILASGLSNGPSMEVLQSSLEEGSDTRAAVQFNASLHKFYSISKVSNQFYPALAVLVLPSWQSKGKARLIQSTLVWNEKIACFCGAQCFYFCGSYSNRIDDESHSWLDFHNLQRKLVTENKPPP